MAAVDIASVHKHFGSTHVIRGVDVAIADGEFCVLVGPSGCGKSTLLRMIAGLEEISGGDLSLNGERVNDLPPSQRGVAMVFQSYALYPHKTVYDNMAFGLKIAKVPKPEIEQRVREASEILQITEYLQRLPKALSGGQRQRVAICRALILHPEVLLLDEITAALDPEMVREVLDVVLELAKSGQTMLIVTHEMQFARAIADHIILLDGGRIVEESYDAQAFFEHPQTERAQQFLHTFEFE